MADALGVPTDGRPMIRFPVSWTSHRHRHGVVLALVYIAGAVALFHAAWFASGPAWMGAGGDPPLFMWYLAWVPHALAHGQSPLLSDWVFHPQGANLMWNTSILFPALLMSPATVLFGPVVAYKLLVTAAVALAAGLADRALLRLGASPLSAAVGGAVYGFSPAIVGESLGHLHLDIAVFPPLLVVLLDEIVVHPRGPRRRMLAGAGLGLATAAQLLTGEELLAITAICALVVLVVADLAWRRQVVPALRRAARPMAVAALVFVVLAAYPAWVMFAGPQRVPGLLQPQDVGVVNLASLVDPTRLQALNWRPPQDSSLSGADGYLGIALVVLLVALAWFGRRSRPLVVAAAGTAVVFVLALGPHLHLGPHTTTGVPLPWLVFERLPLLENLYPERFMIAGFLGVAAVVALGLDELARRPPSVRWSLRALAAIALVGLLPTPSFPAETAATPAFFAEQKAAALPAGGVVLLVPTNLYTDMYWQAMAGLRFKQFSGGMFVPAPGGRPWFGRPPNPLTDALQAVEGGIPVGVSDRLRAAVLGELRTDGVQSVVLGPLADFPPTPDEVARPSATELRTERFLEEVLGHAPAWTGGVYVWARCCAS